MPFIQIKLLEGRSAEEKESLIRETSQIVARIVDCPLTSVRVLIQEVPLEHWGIAGESVKKRLEQTSGKI